MYFCTQVRIQNMTKHFFTIILVLSTLYSCQLFDKSVPTEKELLQKELQKIDWKQVDAYPSISVCEEIMDSEQRKNCFFEYLTQTLHERLTSDSLVLNYPEIDTIEVQVTINTDATVVFEPLFPKDSVAYDTIRIDSILHQKLKDFPKVNPALKRGIPVKTQFILPVILNIE